MLYGSFHAVFLSVFLLLLISLHSEWPHVVVALGRVAFELGNVLRLRRSERNPFTSYFLKGYEEPPHSLEDLFIQLALSLELALEREFSNQKVVIAALAP